MRVGGVSTGSAGGVLIIITVLAASVAPGGPRTAAAQEAPADVGWTVEGTGFRAVIEFPVAAEPRPS